ATYGVRGRSDSTAGRGVFGYASASSGGTFGVYGQAVSPTGYGVYSNGRLGIAAGMPLVCTGCVTASDLGTNAAWGTSGNPATASSTVGTTNPQPSTAKPKNPEGRRGAANGNVGIGTNDPQSLLHVGSATSGLRVEGPASPGGTAVSVGGYGDVAVDAPGTAG